jgi:Ca2+-binding EF-hand superfamily protein
MRRNFGAGPLKKGQQQKQAAINATKDKKMKAKILMAALLSGLVLTAGAAQAENHRERPDFATLDLNGDGALSLEEMQARGEARFAEMDANGDGALSADELVAQAIDRASERVAKMIERFDENGDGMLQQDEMPTRGENRAARMFDRVDADEDGTISAEEFEQAQERMGEGRDGRRGHGHKGRG